MLKLRKEGKGELVAAFTGGVDGNLHVGLNEIMFMVAAFTGGVDGNRGALREQGETHVAAFTGGVDGNKCLSHNLTVIARRRLHGRRGLKLGIYSR